MRLDLSLVKRLTNLVERAAGHGLYRPAEPTIAPWCG